MNTPRRLVAAVATLAFTPLLLVAVGSSPASAASCTITPKSATVYTKAHGVTFDAPGATDWSIEISDLFVFAYDDGPDGSSTAESLDPILYTNADAGAHDAVVSRDSDPDCVTTFTLKRGASISLTAVHKSPYRVLSGTLSRANFGFDGGYAKVKGAKVALQRKTAKGDWLTVKTVTTASNGTFSGKVKEAKHSWRAVYAGSATTGTRTSATRTA